MRNIIAIPLLGLAVIVQSAIVGQFPLLSGAADVTLVMLAAWALQERVTTALPLGISGALMVSLVSRLPWFIYFAAYVGTVLLAMLLQRTGLAGADAGDVQRDIPGDAALALLSLAYLSLVGRHSVPP